MDKFCHLNRYQYNTSWVCLYWRLFDLLSDSGEGSSDSEAVARVAGEDKEATEDKESTMESDASVPGDADAASSSSDVAKMEDSDAEQVTLPLS